jgi:hypothetical protein
MRLPAEQPDGSEFLLYPTDDGSARIQVRLVDETVWLTQRQIAELFDKAVPTINEHIQHAFEEGELDRAATIRQFRIVQTEGARQVERAVEHYNLDVIISVGYRVRSHRGTQFRIWATQRLREYLVKGFVLDDERLKQGRGRGDDYFRELLERIRDIRASERRFYQQITDIYATSIDYDPKHPMSQEFFATVQNKLHWAIHGSTAAEVIKDRANAALPNLGLRTWKNAPAGPIRKDEVTIAKNYLDEDELRRLNRLVTQYLDFAESMAERRQVMTMTAWKSKLDAFLQVNEHDILSHAGKVSHEAAVAKALGEFEKWEARRREFEAIHPASDFDRFIEETKQLEPPPDAGE